ncbi:hypothetical protein, partial [Gluconobacter morbifer]|uniref:hypothetical protein n=1 Tax=Gluconobacter morbifer TaxID=479935 RepID=UPI00058D3DE9
MTVDATSSSAPAAVTVASGGAQDAAPKVTAIGFNAETGQLVFTFSDGSQIPVTGLAEGLAQSLNGASLAV